METILNIVAYFIGISALVALFFLACCVWALPFMIYKEIQEDRKRKARLRRWEGRE